MCISTKFFYVKLSDYGKNRTTKLKYDGLTVGKYYEIIGEFENSYTLMNDQGLMINFPKRGFQNISKTRNTILNNLGI